MDVGDILIEHNGVITIFERKTIADLKSSIKDGRYEEQKLRLKATGVYIVYIIEGKPDSKMVTTSLISLVMRDHFGVIRSDNLVDTINIIETLIRRADDYYPIHTVTPTYESVIKVGKKENMTPSVCFTAQLMQIPGISDTLAKPVSEHFGTMSNMVKMLYPLSHDEQLFILAELRTAERRIGNCAAENILLYLGLGTD
jgi:crossover junction endonuclease MUS81